MLLLTCGDKCRVSDWRLSDGCRCSIMDVHNSWNVAAAAQWFPGQCTRTSEGTDRIGGI